MTRVLVVGPKDQLEGVVERLHAMQLMHLVDHRGEDDVFSIGKPLERAGEVSEQLVKVRSMASVLHIEDEEEPDEAGATDNVDERIRTLEINLLEEDGGRKKIESLLGDLDQKIQAVTPFAELRIPLDLYRGYESLEVLVGLVTAPVAGLDRVTTDHEVASAEGVVVVWVPRAHAAKMRDALVGFGFTSVDIPEESGDPRTLLAQLTRDRKKWADRLEEADERLAKMRRRYAAFLRVVADNLQVQIEKAEAPLRFAVSEHSFVIDGWVPQKKAAELEGQLAGLQGLYVEVSEPAHEEDDPPVLLRHGHLARPLEFLTKLHSTPKSSEIDPTSFLFLMFPVFFGLMIGDAGYGIVMFALGVILSMKFADSDAFRDLFTVFAYGGVWAFLFGLLLFGDIFGIPIGLEEPGELTWSAILGHSSPLYLAPIHKLATPGVIDLIYLSIIASFIHLGMGFVIGFFDEIGHSKKHAASRIGWLVVLIGLVSIFAVLARSPDVCATATTPWCTEVTHRVSNQIFFDNPPFAWIPGELVTIPIVNLELPLFSIVAVLIGVGILIPTEGPLAITEVVSLLANMFSYARLAGVAVAKGAMAVVFNSMLLPFVIDEEAFAATNVVHLNPNFLMVILAFVLLFIAHALVLILGSISAGVQAVRLNYVEFFLKFYKGGGEPFEPFGKREGTTEVATT